MSETSKSFRKSFECFFCSYESPVGHLVQKLLCFQPEYKFADFFYCNDKENKGGNKNQCLYHQCILPLLWEVVTGLACSIMS